MKRNLLLLAVIALILIFCSIAVASSNQMTLLAVGEDKETGEFIGGTADLYLEIESGSGRVFIDTFPITKLDTQMSARLGMEMACDFLEIDCSKYDFFYTIRADSALVGGPSAGGAIAMITAATLDGQSVNPRITGTGTINSGGVIGPVGGVKAKIEAAAEVGLDKVLIPFGESKYKDENETIDLIDYGNELGIEVVEVLDLYDAMYEFTGKVYPEIDGDIEVSEQYVEITENVAAKICNISKNLIDELEEENVNENETDIFNNSLELYDTALEQIEAENYYSAASFCFGANTQLKFIQLLNENFNEEELYEFADWVQERIDGITFDVENTDIETISDLQTALIALDRLEDAERTLDDAREDINNSDYRRYVISNIAYSIERLESAIFWMDFFEYESKKFDFNYNILRNSCIAKLAEAEQRYLYIELFIPEGLEDTERLIDQARLAMEQEDYEICLSKASLAKAESDYFMSASTVDNESAAAFIEQKQRAAKRAFIKQTQQGNFPILAYSYYQYGNSLKEEDPASALLYFEYTLELSNLEPYLKDGSKAPGRIRKNVAMPYTLALYLILGLILGFVIGVIFVKAQRKREPEMQEFKSLKPSRAHAKKKKKKRK